jgi:uncharacterized protein YqeY
MSALKEQLHSDLTTSMKARDALRTSTLRMVLTAIKEVRELSDEDIITVLGAEAKKRREAAQAFTDGDRPELAEKETAEAAILAEYLPAQLSTEEIAIIVTAAVESAGAAGEGMKAMGKVMGIVSPQVKGKADGGAVAAEVKRQIGS